MRKKLLILSTIFVFGTATAESMKPYFDLLYPYISKCVIEQIESPKPDLEVKNKPEIKAYIKAYFNKSGYYVVIDTKNKEMKDICYIEFLIKKIGYEPVYLKPIEKIVVGDFIRKADAKGIKKELSELLGIKEKKKLKYEMGEFKEVKQQEAVKVLFAY